MVEENMNNLASKFLNAIKSWVDARIQDRTKECLRTKIAVITAVKENNLYDVILSGDYNTYTNLNEYVKLKKKEINEELSEEEKIQLVYVSSMLKRLWDENSETTIDDWLKSEIELLTINDLTILKPDTYAINDYVTIGYVDNKLTNSFILFKNMKKGV